jgi:hypothetical protein
MMQCLDLEGGRVVEIPSTALQELTFGRKTSDPLVFFAQDGLAILVVDNTLVRIGTATFPAAPQHRDNPLRLVCDRLKRRFVAEDVQLSHPILQQLS